MTTITIDQSARPCSVSDGSCTAAARPPVYRPLLFRFCALLGLCCMACFSKATHAADHDILGGFISRYCVECHGEATVNAGIDFTGEDYAKLELDDWLDAATTIVDQSMPPDDAYELPSSDERQAVVAIIEQMLSGEDSVRRLSMGEYHSALTQLFGSVPDTVLELLPQDGSKNGYSTSGAAMFLSTTRMQGYLTIAQALVDAYGLADASTPHTQQLSFTGAELPLHRKNHYAKKIGTHVERFDSGRLALHLPGFAGSFGTTLSGGARIDIPNEQPGIYRITMQVGQGPATQWDPHTLRVGCYRIPESTDGFNFEVDHNRVFVDYIDTADGETRAYQFTVHLDGRGGTRSYFIARENADNEIDLPFLDTIYKWARNGEREAIHTYRPLLVDHVDIEGPLPSGGLIGAHLDAEGQIADHRAFIRDVLHLTQRVPVNDVAIAAAQAWIADEQQHFDLSAHQALAKWLVFACCDPAFLFHVEAKYDSGRAIAARASALVYEQVPNPAMLTDWSGTPTQSQLGPRLAAMLTDARSRRFIERLSFGWLHLQRLYDVIPDTDRCQQWNGDLRTLMHREITALVFDAFAANRPLRSLIDSRVRPLNDRLAFYYDIEGPKDGLWTMVPVAEDTRYGLIDMAGVLTMTSNGTRTSPIVRGAWVIESLLNERLPIPPANVPPLESNDQPGKTLTVAEMIKKHRESPACYSCHVKIDPYGLALENYDAFGRYRDEEQRLVIDFPPGKEGLNRFKQLSWKPVGAIHNRATLPGGKEIVGIEGLRTYLLEREDDLALAYAKSIFAYASGRALFPREWDIVEDIVERHRASGYPMRDLAQDILLYVLLEEAQS